jgi:hypothetical protein
MFQESFFATSKGLTWRMRLPVVTTNAELIGNPAVPSASATHVLHVLNR